MTRHLRMLTAGLALALLPLTASPAHATSHYESDCGYMTVSQETVTGPDRYTGVAYASVVLYSSDHGNVVNATVTCELLVNGVTQATVSRWGSGVVVFAAPITFVAGDTDTIDFCTIVDFTSDDTPTSRQCAEPTRTQFPPQELIDLFSVLFNWVNGAIVTYVDPVVCAVLQEDLYVADVFIYDCPPYEWPAPEPWPEPVPPPLPNGEPFVPTGAGYNTGDAGFLLLTAPETHDVATACGYAKDPGTGTITVVGNTTTAGASSASVRCRLTDTASGTVLYDQTITATGPRATLLGTAPAHDAPVTVCTEGTGAWPDRSVTAGPHCRPGEPLDRVLS